MHKYFAIIDQKTAHVLILCLVITWLCFQFNFSFNLNVTLFSIAVIFPLAIALGINWFSSTGLPLAEFIGAALVWLALPFEVALIALSYSTIQKIQSIAVDAPEDTND